MAVVGFNFTKLSCERKKLQAKGSIEIKHNITISSVEKAEISLVSKSEAVLKVGFTFGVSYGEGVGSIDIAGEVLYSDTKDIVDETIKGFKSDKKLNSTVALEINKFIYSKSIIKALEMSDNTNLPAPIPVVPVGLKKKK